MKYKDGLNALSDQECSENPVTDLPPSWASFCASVNRGDYKKSDSLKSLKEMDAWLFYAAAFRIFLFRNGYKNGSGIEAELKWRSASGNLRSSSIIIDSDIDSNDCFEDVLTQFKNLSPVKKLQKTNPTPPLSFKFTTATCQEMTEAPEERGHINQESISLGVEFTPASNPQYWKLTWDFAAAYISNSIQNIRGIFLQLLESITMHPHTAIDQLNMLSLAERKTILEDFNSPAEQLDPMGPSNVLDLFKTLVNKFPGTVAVKCENNSVSYKELDALSDHIAKYLLGKGIKVESMIPICMERSIEMVASIIGILKAGAAYVPVDKELPAERIHFMLNQIDAEIFLMDEESGASIDIPSALEVIQYREMMKQDPISDHPLPKLKPNQLAYVIFTSGTTGEPKGVMVEHAQLFSSTLARHKFYHIIPSVLLIPSFSFDASVAALFWPITSGGNLVIAKKEHIQDVHKLPFLLSQTDTLLCVPAYYRFLLDESLIEKSNISTVILGGESFKQDLVAAHFKMGRKINLYNEYGPTETTVWATASKIESCNQPITIGRPIQNIQCHILDKTGSLVPIGVSGELHISGGGVARGYLKNESLTSDKFIRDPFSPSENSSMYKTGDICHWLPDGNIVFEGRKDEQVKIQGYRVEPGEIESIILQEGSVEKTVVLTTERANKEKALVAYIVPKTNFSQKDLSGFLRKKLPPYMVPAFWVLLDKIPLTPNGKIDKKSLPEPETASLKNYEAGSVSKDENELALLSVWKRLLDAENLSVNDNFFELGGSSLTAMRLVAAIQREMGKAIQIEDVFRFPTIRSLKTQLEGKPVKHVEKKKPTRPKHLPVSFNQESLWFVDQLEGSISYHLPIVYKIEGNLDAAALERSLREIIRRHESLRTIIIENGGPKEQHTLAPGEWSMTIFDKREHNYSEPPTLSDQIGPLLQKPFNLSRDYMIRGALILYKDNIQVLALVIHHIAFDAWSLPILLEELGKLYAFHKANKPHELKPLPFQYGDFALYQREWVHNPSFQSKINYWKNKLAGVKPLQIPTDYPRPAKRDQEGSIIRFTLEKELKNGLNEIGQRIGATLFMTLLTSFKVLLYRYTSEKDICVGTAMAERQLANTEGLIGYFINSVVLRNEIDPQASFTEILEQVKYSTIEAFRNGEVPFETVVKEVSKIRNPHGNPLFNLMFVWQSMPKSNPLELLGTQCTKIETDLNTSKFDITFNLEESDGAIKGAVEYSTALFEAATIDRMVGHYKELLASIIQEPDKKAGKLNFLATSEKNFLLGGSIEYSTKFESIVQLFDQQVESNPDKTALVYGDSKLSYRDLDRKANCLANLLISKGVNAEALVLLCTERSLEMVVGILGILKAGAAYVPIDPLYPEERVRFIQEDTAAKWALTTPQSKTVLSEQDGLTIIEINDDVYSNPSASPGLIPRPDHLAYVIYTSGSTGKPKGVMLEHQNLAGFINWCQEEFSKEQFNILYATTSICFDLSVFELFYPLSTGKPVRIIESGLHIKEILPRDERVFLNCVPSVVQNLIHQNVDFSRISLLNMAGEPIPLSLLENLDTEHLQVRNLYGPTEDTTYSTCYKLDKSKNRYIGKPIQGTYIHILSPEHELCPVGVAGEICIGGKGLARGYWNRPELTAERFIPDPFSPHQTIYKTGDIGKWLPDGNIDFIGRKDFQVKIRGYRIELGEIEHMLQKCMGVKQAVVLARTALEEEKQLVGYLVTEPGFERKLIQAELKSKLPAYMIPNLWTYLDDLPLTPNGKVDRQALAALETSQVGDQERGYLAPRSSLETALVNIWQELLKRSHIGIHDDFFELGGHSLLGARLISAIKSRFKVEVGIRDLFSQPTIAGLAAFLQPKLGFIDIQSIERIEKVVPRPEFTPLSYGQESLWLIDRLQGSTQYHIPIILKFNGKLDNPALEKALKTIIGRHEILRTVIKESNGKLWQMVKSTENWQMDRVPVFPPHANVKEILRQYLYSPFDLEEDYMFRARLIPVDSDTTLLIMVVHHISFDGWSVPILVKELFTLYEAFSQNKVPALPDLNIQYADYALWQRQHRDEAYLQEKLGFWKEKLNGIQPLRLPVDFPRPSERTSKGMSVDFFIGQELHSDINQLARKYGASAFMVLLAVSKTLFQRYSGQDDICIGTALAGRNHIETEPLIGYFINPLPIRSTIDIQASFTQILKEVKTNCLEAFDHQEVPFEKIVAATSSQRELGSNPLFQVMLVMQHEQDFLPSDTDTLKVTQESFRQNTSKFDLTFLLNEKENGIEGSLEYATDLFKEDTIKRLIDEYLSLIKTVCAQPDTSLEKIYPNKLLLSEEVEQTGTVETDILSEFVPVPRMIEEKVAGLADKTAIVFGEDQYTYNELNTYANQLAHALLEKGVKQGDIVGIVMDRSLEMVISVLAVLKAGAAYLPVDTDFPLSRIVYMLDDACKWYITHSVYQNSFETAVQQIVWENFKAEKDQYSKQNPSVSIQPHDAAYIIYTSGSTGRPKGVVLEHHNLFNFLKAAQVKPGISPSDKVLAVSSISFDIAILETILPYVWGATCVLLDKDQRKDPKVILSMIPGANITLMFATPSHWKMMLAAGWTERYPEFRIISGGEALPPQLAAKLLPLCKELWNIYGPTETTVYSTIKQITDAAEIITVGKPVRNTQVHILDEKLQPVLEGEKGEICIAGNGVARGYLNRQELTAEKFLPNPMASVKGSRLYRTGDIGHYLPNGEIVISGRIDHQIKIRGYRVELGEIEYALTQLIGIEDAVADFQENAKGTPVLLAYLKMSPAYQKQHGKMSGKPHEVTLAQKKRWKRDLSLFLPDYMVPLDFIIMENFPLSDNGKVNRKALPKLIPKEDPFILKAKTPEEKLVARIWEEALGIGQVDITDNFFEIGGHSLIAVQVMVRLEQVYGVKLPLSILFKYPTVQKLAHALKTGQFSVGEWNSLVPIKSSGKNTPLYIVHGGGLNILPFYAVAKHMDEEQPVYGIQAKGLDGVERPLTTVESIASQYVQELLKQNPHGPYLLAGYSLGGIIAYEMAKQLEALGKEVGKVILFDTYAYQSDHRENWKVRLRNQIRHGIGKRVFDLYLWRHHPDIFKRIKVNSLRKKVNQVKKALHMKVQSDETDLIKTFKKVESVYKEACKEYVITPRKGSVHLLKARIQTGYLPDAKYMGWKPYVDNIRVWEVEGEHIDMLSPTHAPKFAEILQQVIKM